MKPTLPWFRPCCSAFCCYGSRWLGWSTLLRCLLVSEADNRRKGQKAVKLLDFLGMSLKQVVLAVIVGFVLAALGLWLLPDVVMRLRGLPRQLKSLANLPLSQPYPHLNPQRRRNSLRFVCGGQRLRTIANL